MRGNLQYPFTIKPSISTLGSVMEFSRQKPPISYTPNDSLQDLLAFTAGTIYEKNFLSSEAFDLLSFDFFLWNKFHSSNVFQK